MGATHEARRSGADKVVAHCGAPLPEVELSFYGFPPFRPYLYCSVVGAEPAGLFGGDWFERCAVEHVLGDQALVGSCLSLCCGFGEIERILARLGAFERCRAIDFPEPATEAAREAAA